MEYRWVRRRSCLASPCLHEKLARARLERNNTTQWSDFFLSYYHCIIIVILPSNVLWFARAPLLFFFLKLPCSTWSLKSFESTCSGFPEHLLSKVPVFKSSTCSVHLLFLKVPNVLWFPRPPLCFLSKTPVFSGWFSDDVLIAQIVIHRAATLVSFLNVSGIIRSLTVALFLFLFF